MSFDSQFGDGNYTQSRPRTIKPKAARLLGLVTPTGSAAPWSLDTTRTDDVDTRRQSSDDNASMLEPDMQQQVHGPLTPQSPDSGNGQTRLFLDTPSVTPASKPSRWTPDWPEPDAEYVEAMMRRRPSMPPYRQGLLANSDLDDPLVVWQREALLNELPGIPKNATNKWIRYHGWQLPLDSYFVIQWVGSLTLTSGYFVILRPLAYSASSIAMFGHMKIIDYLGMFWIASSYLLNIYTSLKDPKDPEVSEQIADRNLYYKQIWGVPVIDPMSACSIYMVYTAGWKESQFATIVGNSFANGKDLNIQSSLVITIECLIAVYFVLAAGLTIAVGMLFGLHVKLCVLGTTTIEYSDVQQKKRRERDSQEQMIPLTSMRESEEYPFI
ncbi:hypothetical protein GGF39_000565 [Coemansia sp. RSA 1721]|nr:hypothetical protein GGF39_000565 [Coemansia sp. RSA 1721]